MDNAKENLSAFIDGELGRSETAFLLRRVGHDPDLRLAAASYHLIGDCLRRRSSVAPVAAAFADGVRAAIETETIPRRAASWQGGMRWAAGFFTAAIVAAGAFWSVQTGHDADSVAAAPDAGPASEVVSSGVRADDLRRQLPLIPVSARQSRPLSAREFAPQPDPETWQQAPVAPLQYPTTQYIVVLPARPGNETANAAERR